MASTKFMAYLAQAHAIAKGRGRVSWGVDFEVWDPKKTNAQQRSDSWIATFTPVDVNPATQILYARAADGQEALRLLVVSMASRYGFPDPTAN